MTCCIYSNDALYCDRAGVSSKGITQPVEMIKLMILSNKTLAMAISGPKFYTEDPLFKDFIAYLRKQSKICAGLKSQMVVPEKWTDYIGARSLILMTPHATFDWWSPSDIGNDTPTGVFNILDPSIPTFIGSGRDFASIAMVAGKTPLEAIAISQRIDVNSYLTPVDSIERKDLRVY